MSNFLQLLSPLLRKFRTSTRSSLSKQQNSQTSSSSENNEHENENEEATKTTPEEKEKSRRSETDPPTNEKQPQLSKATKGIYDLRIDKQTWITLKIQIFWIFTFSLIKSRFNFQCFWFDQILLYFITQIQTHHIVKLQKSVIFTKAPKVGYN